MTGLALIFSVRAALHAKERIEGWRSFDSTASNTRLQLLSYRVSNQLKKSSSRSYPFDHLYRSFADFSVLNDHSLMLNVLLHFFSLLAPDSSLSFAISPSVFFFFHLCCLCLLMSCQKFTSDVTYAEKFTKVPTYYPLVAVECTFDVDEVISSYYTLWHHKEWPVRERKESPFLFPPLKVTLVRGFFFRILYHEFGVALFIYSMTISTCVYVAERNPLYLFPLFVFFHLFIVYSMR